MKYKIYIRYMLNFMQNYAKMLILLSFLMFFDKNGRFGKYSNKPSRPAGDGDFA